jgi:hypothetical protein
VELIARALLPSQLRLVQNKSEIREKLVRAA